MNDCYKMIVKLTSLYKLWNKKCSGFEIEWVNNFYRGISGGFSPVSPLLRMPLSCNLCHCAARADQVHTSQSEVYDYRWKVPQSHISHLLVNLSSEDLVATRILNASSLPGALLLSGWSKTDNLRNALLISSLETTTMQRCIHGRKNVYGSPESKY